jgi:hypothetical protein
MAKRKNDRKKGGMETPPDGGIPAGELEEIMQSQKGNGLKVLNNFSDLAKLKENMPDATSGFKEFLAKCLDDKAVIDSIFKNHAGLHPTPQDISKLVKFFQEEKPRIINDVVALFETELGLQKMLDMLKDGGMEKFVEYYSGEISVKPARNILEHYKDILNKKGKLAKNQQGDPEEIGGLLFDTYTFDDVDIAGRAEEYGKTGPETVSNPDRSNNPEHPDAPPASPESADSKKDQEKFLRILDEFSEKFNDEKVAAVERMRRLTNTHVGLPFQIEAIRGKVEELRRKFQDSEQVKTHLAEIEKKWENEQRKKGSRGPEKSREEKERRKNKPVTAGFISGHIAGLLKGELGENEKTFVEDAKELEIAERKVQKLISDYAFGKEDEVVDDRIGAAVETIREAGVRLKLSPDKIKERYIEAKRSVLRGLVSKVLASDDDFRKILSMKKEENVLEDPDLKRLVMAGIRQMIVQAFERKERLKKVAPQPPENIPVVSEVAAEEGATTEAGPERDISGLEEKMAEKFNEDEKKYRDEQIEIYKRRLRKHIERHNLGSEEISNFKSKFIASLVHLMQRNGMAPENAKVLEEYLLLKLPVSIEKTKKASVGEKAADGEKAPVEKISEKTDFEPRSAKEKIIWDIVSREVDLWCESAPESEYKSFFEEKFDKDKADWRKQGLTWKDADFIADIFKAEREKVKAGVLKYIEDEMKKSGKDFRRATLKEISDLARKGRRKEIDEYFQKAVRGELGLKEKEEEMTMETKFSKEEMETLDSLSRLASEVFEEELGDSKSWGGKWTRERVLEYFRPVLEANMEEILEQRGFDGTKRKTALERILARIK